MTFMIYRIGKVNIVTDQTALILRLKQREPEALTKVFEAHSDKIYRLAVGILQDEQQADGVVQDTFIKLIEAIDKFEGRADIGTWLYRVAYHECVGRKRRSKPDVSVDDMLDDDFMPECFVNWGDIPDTVLNNQEAMTEMERAINELPEALATVFRLRDVEGLSTAETAHILNLSESATKVRLHRARLMLREKLANYFQEWTRI